MIPEYIANLKENGILTQNLIKSLATNQTADNGSSDMEENNTSHMAENTYTNNTADNTPSHTSGENAVSTPLLKILLPTLLTGVYEIGREQSPTIRKLPKLVDKLIANQILAIPIPFNLRAFFKFRS